MLWQAGKALPACSGSLARLCLHAASFPSCAWRPCMQVEMMTGNWPGFRALVTLPDGQQRMVQMPHAGAQTFLEDHLAGGTFGGFWRSRRMADDPLSLHQYGYNQVGKACGIAGHICMSVINGSRLLGENSECLPHVSFLWTAIMAAWTCGLNLALSSGRNPGQSHSLPCAAMLACRPAHNHIIGLRQKTFF